jgi:signal transduction histidine kinase
MHAGWWFGRAPVSIGLGFFVVLVTTMVGHAQHHPVDPLGYALMVLPALVLLWRNRFPLLVFLVVGPLVGWYFLSGNPTGPIGLYLIFALFTLSLLRGPVIASIAAVGMFGYAFALWVALDRLGEFDGRVGFVVAPVGIVIAAGAVLTARRNTVMARQEQAEERTRRLAEEERLRIAREVHDVVAHSLAMINVQAGVGAHVADRRPEEAKAALLAIKQASQSALADLRATLAVLRGSEDRAPAPSLTRLSELTDATTAAGLRVEVDGEPGELPAPVDSAAYRIVQESLTNAVRHAKDATRIFVRFAQSNGSIEVVVRDDGAGSMDPGSGNGLRGMRERAEALGGTLRAGATSNGGYEVRAVLPVSGGET